MHRNTGVIIFMAILFIIIVIALIRPIMEPSGRATSFIEKLCTTAQDCDPGLVCCFFTGQTSGVCDLPDNCEYIRDATASTGLPKVQQPLPGNPEVFYGALVAMFALVIVMALIFYKKKASE